MLENIRGQGETRGSVALYSHRTLIFGFPLSEYVWRGTP